MAKKKGLNPNRNQTVSHVIAELRNSLIDKGFDPQDALRFARVSLTRPGVTIGRGGRVHYRKNVFDPSDFADSQLVKLVTGLRAKQANEATIKADPAYQMALAQLGLSRDQSVAGLEDQRRQALINFGDGSFVKGDPALAAAAEANPFGTAQLLEEAYKRQNVATRNQAGTQGTIFGGGYQSGLKENTRVYAGSQAEATKSLTDLLNSLSMQKTNIQQQYDLGSRAALLQAQQTLSQNGALQSVSPPKFGVGTYNWFKPPKPANGGGGSGGSGSGVPGPPPPPHRVLPNPNPVKALRYWTKGIKRYR